MVALFNAIGKGGSSKKSLGFEQDKEQSLNPFEPNAYKLNLASENTTASASQIRSSINHYQEDSVLYPSKKLLLNATNSDQTASSMSQETLSTAYSVIYTDSIETVHFLNEEKTSVGKKAVYSILAEEEKFSSSINYFLCIYDKLPTREHLRWKASFQQIKTTCVSETSVCIYQDFFYKFNDNDGSDNNVVKLTSQFKKNSDESASPTGFYQSDCAIGPIYLKFISIQRCAIFLSYLKNKAFVQPQILGGHLNDADASAVQAYFHYYAKLSNQMNMLQDSVRTKIYQDAILSNITDFCLARVMDIGAGTGILSFFAAQAGANIVYAVEASAVCTVIPVLANSNVQYKEKIKAVHSTIERLNLSTHLDNQKVDVLVSEPIGTFLFNERMLESYLFARDNFLSPNGKMFPSRYRLYLAPFTDHQLFQDMKARCSFWLNQNFYGINLSSLYSRAVEEQFRQPVVDYVDPANLVCQTFHEEEFDLKTISRESLSEMIFNFDFPILYPCLIHGIAGWFDVIFEGTNNQLNFSTSPWCRPTHWYQMRFVFQQPLAVNANQNVVGSLTMKANSQQSYNICVTAVIQGTSVGTSTVTIDLKDPDYRYYSNPQASYMPNTHYNAFAQNIRVDALMSEQPTLTNNTNSELYQPYNFVQNSLV